MLKLTILQINQNNTRHINLREVDGVFWKDVGLWLVFL